ncbi:trans-resveratrol di-O-methyltransferase-like protein [Tanacetum coccineum]
MDNNQRLGGANELFEAQAHIYRHIFYYATSMSLKCALELGIPDIIHDHEKPITIQELVSKLNFPVEKTHNLQRLMRDSFWEKRQQRIRSFYEAFFNDAMASDSQMMSLVVKDSKEIFEGVHSLVDVGGWKPGLKRRSERQLPPRSFFPEITCTRLLTSSPLTLNLTRSRTEKSVKYLEVIVFTSNPISLEAKSFLSLIYCGLLEWFCIIGTMMRVEDTKSDVGEAFLVVSANGKVRGKEIIKRHATR